MNTLFDKLVTYWSQITVLLFGIGFLIQKIIDLKNKKLEIRYALFQEKKIEAILKFIEQYKLTERMWKELSIHKIINKSITVGELDTIITTPMFDLSSSLSELTIYLSEKDRQPFKSIVDSFYLINSVVSDILFDHIKGDSIKLSNEYSSIQTKYLNDSRKQLEKIGETTRKIYSS